MVRIYFSMFQNNLWSCSGILPYEVPMYTKWKILIRECFLDDLR